MRELKPSRVAMPWWRRLPLPVVVEVALAALTVIAAHTKRQRTNAVAGTGRPVFADGCPGLVRHPHAQPSGQCYRHSKTMCLAVYIASPAPLPLVAWQEETPAFYVQEAEADDPVRAHFQWPNVYYAGSHEGCGCGFAYNQMPQHLQEADDEARRRASVAALREYVTKATALGRVQLFACWEGEQSFPEKDRATVSPDALGGEAFDFEQLRTLEFPGRDS